MLYPETRRARLRLAGARARPALHPHRPDRRRRHPRLPRRGRAPRRPRRRRHRRDPPAPALVEPLGRPHLPHRQARLHLRRRHPRRRRRPHRPRRDGLRGGRPRLLQPRVRPAHPRPRQGLRPRGADHRRLPRGRGRHRRHPSRADPRHPDGAPHRQAPRHPLRRDLRPRPRPGLPRPHLAAGRLGGRQRHLRHLDPPAGHGAGGTPPAHVPRRLRVQRRRRPQPPRRGPRRHARAARPTPR